MGVITKWGLYQSEMFSIMFSFSGMDCRADVAAGKVKQYVAEEGKHYVWLQFNYIMDRYSKRKLGDLCW